ncbi:MAG TPA: hypothetical protein VIV60_17490 [Polyangiaceae bacterium]
MNELSPRARALVEAHRNSKMLTLVERDRLRQGVLLRVAALGAAGATAGTAAGMSLAAKIGWAALAFAIVGGAGSAWVLRGHTVNPTRVAQPSLVPTPLDVVAPAAAASEADGHPSLANEVASPRTTPQLSLTPANSQSMNPGRVDVPKKTVKHPALVSAPEAVSASAAVAVPLSPEPELQLLRQAREDLQRGQAEVAFRRLSDYDREHGPGVLMQERQALKAIALCRWRPGADAQARAAQFLRSAPESPLANRVRSACEATTSVPR